MGGFLKITENTIEGNCSSAMLDLIAGVHVGEKLERETDFIEAVLMVSNSCASGDLLAIADSTKEHKKHLRELNLYQNRLLILVWALIFIYIFEATDGFYKSYKIRSADLVKMLMNSFRGSEQAEIKNYQKKIKSLIASDKVSDLAHFYSKIFVAIIGLKDSVFLLGGLPFVAGFASRMDNIESHLAIIIRSFSNKNPDDII